MKVARIVPFGLPASKAAGRLGFSMRRCDLFVITIYYASQYPDKFVLLSCTQPKFRLIGRLIPQHRPADPCQLIGDGYRGLVEAALRADLQCPAA